MNKTHKIKLLLIFCLGLCVFCHRNTQLLTSYKTLVNGDFEQDLSVGWSKNSSGLSYSDHIDRAADLDDDDDYELIIEKVSAGHIKLFQTVDISTTNLRFSVQANLRAIEHNPYASYWAAAAICLRYLNENNNLLGETRIVHKSPNCPWQNTNRLHLIHAYDSINWHTYSFNIDDILSHLAGVNSLDIKKIQIVLMDTPNGC